jgi:hypothetical protein
MPTIKHVHFLPEASYLIVGGMGKIGRELARYMATLGCSNIIILSLTAADNPLVSSLIPELDRLCCTLTVRNCNVADEASLSSVLQACYHGGIPVVRGVVHAAHAVHQESAFEYMNFEQWHSAIRPKLDATSNLHRALPDLEFFVMLSSSVGVRGSFKQANYAAGSTYQDVFARFRRSQNLPAVSVDLGPIDGISFIAENDVADEAISIKQAMRLIELAMLKPRQGVESSQLITGLGNTFIDSDAKIETANLVAWRRDRRFGPLQLSSSLLQEDLGSVDKTTSVIVVKDSVGAAKDWHEVIACCVGALASKVADMFAVPLEGVDVSLPMAYYGVDSLVAVEVRNWLSASARAELSTFDIMQSTSLAALAHRVAEMSQSCRDLVTERKWVVESRE